MTTLRSEFADRTVRYQSLNNFYSADRRRRASPERDVGLWWRRGAHGPIYRAAWVRETGELYVTRLGRLEDGAGEVVVLGRAATRSELEEVFDGWQDVCPQPDSMTWLRHKAACLEAPEKPAQSLARPPASRLSGRAPARRSHRCRQDARGFPIPDVAA